MNVAVVDVGSNTVRLLVASVAARGLRPVREEKAVLLLGEEVERHGSIRPEKLAAVSTCVTRYGRIAREAGAARTEVLVTAPGRQSTNASEVIAELSRAAAAPARVISADEEGRLAFVGALADVDDLPESVAVVDVGGGSTEIVVGTPAGGPAWLRSADIGCVRLTERHLRNDPPGKEAMLAASAEAERHLDGIVPPIAQSALGAGGTARALRKVVGPSLGAEELSLARRRTAKRCAKRLAETYGVDPSRARMLAAGAVILGIVQERLAVPLVVARGGLREGAALELLAEQRAA